jgi:hypothetical protein
MKMLDLSSTVVLNLGPGEPVLTGFDPHSKSNGEWIGGTDKSDHHL